MKQDEQVVESCFGHHHGDGVGFERSVRRFLLTTGTVSTGSLCFRKSAGPLLLRAQAVSAIEIVSEAVRARRNGPRRNSQGRQ
jgi:hypothetical protein